jgi:hypothetical protein
MKKTICLLAMLIWAGSLAPSLAEDIAVITASSTHAGYLFDHEKISSPNGQYNLVMQKDGNLVLYDSKCGAEPKCAVWNSGSFREQGQYFMAIQPDGNLVIYKGKPPAATPQSIWDSKTYGKLDNYFLAIQDDANVVIYRGTPNSNRGPIWSSKTGKIK